MNTAAVKDNNKLFLFKEVSVNKYKLIEMNIFKSTADETKILLFENYRNVFSLIVTLMLYSLFSDISHFNKNNVLKFLKCYDNLCNNFHLSNKEKIYYLFKYYKFQISLYIKVISE